MRTRSQSRNSNRQQQQVTPTFFEPFNLVEPIENQAPPVVTMDDSRAMAQLLKAPTEGYEDAIVVPEITADNFELKHGLLTLVQNKQFSRHDKEDPHAHIRYFNKITSTMKFPNVPSTSVKLMLFLFTLEGATRIWIKKEPPRSILTWDDLALLLDKNFMLPAPVKAVEESCVTCGGAHSYRNCLATDGNTYRNNIQEYVSQAAAANFNQGNTSYRAPIANQNRPPGVPPVQGHYPKEDLNGITTRSGVTYHEPTIPTTTSSPPKVVERETEVTKDTPVVAPVSTLIPNPKSSIPYPSRRNNERCREKANDQIEKFYKIIKDLSFKISLTDALILMPKFASTLKALIGNKEKLSEMASTPLNEHCSVCGNSTCMTLELVDRLITQPIGIVEDVYLKVGKFKFPADFVVVDFDANPRVPLILERSFSKTGGALINVYEGELTLHVGKEAITFNLDQTSRYFSNYDDMTTNRIDVIEMACEEHFQEVLGFSNVIASGNPTPYYDPIVSTSSPTLTPFGDSDFLLEEVDAFLALEDDPTSPEVDDSYFDPEGDILLLEAFLNNDPSLPPPTQGNYLPKIQKELKVCEAKTNKSSIDEPPEVELKDLPPHLEYAFLEGDNKLPVIIAKDLSVEEKAALIKVLKSHKRAIAWKLSDI
ncbi:reverse transcriptase domain-containing protein [Tanacetum coccineum]